MSKARRILLVEDDEPLRGMYKERFSKENFQVMTAENGEEAIEVALREVPELILLDLFLPKKGGLSTLEVLKSQPATRNIPVIILTAYPREEYREKGMRDGAIMFISKSEMVPGEVVEKVKEVLNR